MRAICIRCLDPDALVSLYLDGSGVFHCTECEEEFTCANVRELLAQLNNQWGRLILWAEAYPTDAGK